MYRFLFPVLTKIKAGAAYRNPGPRSVTLNWEYRLIASLAACREPFFYSSSVFAVSRFLYAIQSLQPRPVRG